MLEKISLKASLQETCGFQYASKLQRMFQDIRLSTDLSYGYKEYCEREKLSFTCKTQ